MNSFVADKYKVEISECKTNRKLFKEWLEEKTPSVEHSVTVDLSKEEIKVIVSDHLRVTVNSVTDPDLLEQAVCTWGSRLLIRLPWFSWNKQVDMV